MQGQIEVVVYNFYMSQYALHEKLLILFAVDTYFNTYFSQCQQFQDHDYYIGECVL